MNLAPVEAIVKAVLYEGYILYPYRASNVKNRQRWTFGDVYPRQDDSFACSVQTECLVRGSLESVIEVHVRFLHLMRREVGEFASPMTEPPAGQEPAYTNVASLKVGEGVSQSWEEAVERDVTAPSLMLKQLTGAPVKMPFAFAGQRSLKLLRGQDGYVYGLLIHTSADVQGELTIAAAGVAPGVFRLTVRIDNVTPLGDTGPSERREARWRAFASTHTILGVHDGAFISLLDPPNELKDAAAACNNQGTWPVLAGEEGTGRDRTRRKGERNMSQILVAGIGNIFKGDDAFGVEVVQRLAQSPLPAGVKVVDFGIRGIDLTYALLDGYDAAILVDTARRARRLARYRS
jgi:hypothetical protein